MTVRFKTEYQRSFRSRSVSPQRSAQFAGLRSVNMGISREPCLQRRKKFLRARSCGPPHLTFTDPVADAEPSKLTAVLPLAEPEAPPGPRRADGPSVNPVDADGNPEAIGGAVEPQNSRINSPVLPDKQQPPPINHSLRRKAGLGSRRQPHLHKTEYNRQFDPKKAPEAPSPLLTAQNVLYTSHSMVPPFKNNPVAMDTEYQRSFQGQAPPTGPRLRKKLEHEQAPLFYTLTKRKHKLLQKKHEPGLENERNNRPLSSSKQRSPDHAPSHLRRHRILTEYESRFCAELGKVPEEEEAMVSHMPQVKELRDRAQSYRRRAWGTNFSRDHLSQLLSEHNALWEPTETTDSGSDRPQPTRLDLSRLSSAQSDLGRTSSLEALDLASNSSRTSKRSSAVDLKDGELIPTNEITKTNVTPPRSVHSCLDGEELPEDEQDKGNGEEEGRLPTPKLKMFPVQRTHLDLTTPATAGGAILVGKLAGSDEASVRSGTADSVLARAGTSVCVPLKPIEAWPDLSQHKPVPSSGSKTQSSPPVAFNTNAPCSGSKPGLSQSSPPVAFNTNAPSSGSKPGPSQSSPPVALNPNAPLHCIQGTLRHADFQHNGELGLRFKEQKCTRGCCSSDEDDRLSVLSWRSAASCSVASAVLQRSLKRRDDFWGKR